MTLQESIAKARRAAAQLEQTETTYFRVRKGCFEVAGLPVEFDAPANEHGVREATVRGMGLRVLVGPNHASEVAFWMSSVEKVCEVEATDLLLGFSNAADALAACAVAKSSAVLPADVSVVRAICGLEPPTREQLTDAVMDAVWGAASLALAKASAGEERDAQAPQPPAADAAAGASAAATHEPAEKAGFAHVTDVQGVPIHIDRPKGFVQQGTAPDGTSWERTYKFDYGFIAGTSGGDSEGLDCYVGPEKAADTAYWIRQRKSDGAFDEYKVMLGFPSEEEAVAAYKAHTPETFYDGCHPMPMAMLKALCGVCPQPAAKSLEAVAHQAARHAHEINRAYCASMGDMSQPAWEEAPEWQRKSAIVGAEAMLTGKATSPEEQHALWMDAKVADGWTHGPVKDPAAKTHPCLVPYADLPVEQKVKDHLFRAAVKGAAELLEPPTRTEAGVEESKANHFEHAVHVAVRGDALACVKKTLLAMQTLGRIGASRRVLIEDMGRSGDGTTMAPWPICYFDGDGSDKIDAISIDGEVVKEEAAAPEPGGLEHIADVKIHKAFEGYILGVVLEPEPGEGRGDLQGDVYSAEEVRKTQLKYLRDFRAFDIQHKEVIGADDDRIVLADIFCTSDVIKVEGVKEGTWVMGAYVKDPDLKAAIAAGKFTGFSIKGVARKVPEPMPTAPAPA